MAQSNAVIVLQVLHSTASDAELEPILALSRTVFDAAPTESHHLVSTWRKNFARPQSLITYATTADHPATPLGYFFVYETTQPEVGVQAPHIWMAAVLETARGLGIFPMLMAETRKRAVQAGHNLLTVCTVPERFPKMYRILQKHGWEVVAWRSAKPDKEGPMRVLLRLYIS